MMESIYQRLTNIGYTHPLHPILAHVVIGLVVGGFLFGLIAWLQRRSTLATTARHCMALGLITLIPAALLGYMDWQYRFAGAWWFPIKMKLALAGLLFVLLCIALSLRHRTERLSTKILVVFTLCFFTVVAIGYFGGELVYGKKATAEEAQGAIVREGAHVFNQNCAVCHFTDKTDTKIGPGLKGLFARETLPVSGRPVTEENIRRQLRTPFKNMPPFPDLAEEKVKALIAYLKSV